VASGNTQTAIKNFLRITSDCSGNSSFNNCQD